METVDFVIGIVGVVIGLLINLKNLKRNEKNEIKNEAKEETQLNTELKVRLESIGHGVEDIKVSIRSQDVRISGIAERVTRVEESTKQAHKRIDELKEEK